MNAVKIYNADCFEIFKEMQDNSVDITFTSPPYNRKRNDKYTFFEDINDDYFDFLCRAVEESIRVSKKWVFFNIMPNYYNSQSVYQLFGKYSKEIVNVFIWEKLNPLPASGNSITNSFEYIIVFGKEPLKSKTTYTKNIIQTGANSDMPKIHKAVMHPDVADYFMSHFTNEGDTVFDCFMGTGTTGVSAIKHGCNFIGVEISKEYYEYASQNINLENNQMRFNV